jgi:eukaryotic-like serine/threonine-protein kinase
MQQVYLRNPDETKRKVVRVGPRFAGGAAGDIHRLPDVRGQVLKLYKTNSLRNLYAAKLEAMLDRRPKLLSSKAVNKNFPQLAWPVSIAEDKKRQFLGFSMPEIDFDNSVSLERMLQRRMREVSGLPTYYGYRFLAAHNVALSVAALHKIGHHVIDLKPINCRLHPGKMLISILDCDGFSIKGGDGNRFHANQFTPEYIAPEASQNKPNELGEKQDLFALAVIIFRLLNNGLHPFQARLPKGLGGGTIQEMINANYYAYSSKNQSNCLPARQSVHESFPDELRGMFDQAFMCSVRPTAAKWRDILREYADPSAGKLIRCAEKPEEHAYFDENKGCGWCVLDEINQQTGQNISKPSSAITTPRRTKGSIIPLSTLSRVQGRPFLIMVIFSALSLLAIPNFLYDMKLMSTNNVRKAEKQKRLGPSSPSSKKSQGYVEKVIQMNKTGFVTARTNIRSGAGINSAVIITVPQGTELKVYGKVDKRNWYLVELGGEQAKASLRGYVYGNLLAILR